MKKYQEIACDGCLSVWRLNIDEDAINEIRGVLVQCPLCVVREVVEN